MALTSGAELRRGLRVQARVIHALMLREVITRFGRHNLGVLWLMGEPMLFTAAVATLWWASGMSHGSSLPIVAFAVTGYSSVLMWRNTVGRCTAALQQNLSLLYHRHVKVLDIMVSRIALECVGTVASFTVLTLALLFAGMMQPPQDLLQVVGGLALLAWFSAALGLVIGSLAAISEIVERFWHPLAYVLLPLSGSVFMVDWLPPAAREFVLLLPMVHCLELLREGYFGHVVRTWYDIPYVLSFNMVLTLVGLAGIWMASRRTEGL
jgi:capsular polysaccharide transport system permease protein